MNVYDPHIFFLSLPRQWQERPEKNADLMGGLNPDAEHYQLSYQALGISLTGRQFTSITDLNP